MSRSCVVPGCDHQQQACNLKRFPVNPVRLQKWLKNMNRKDNWKPRGLDRICECHFDESQFEEKGDGSKKLRTDAIPTIFSKKKSRSRKIKSHLQSSDIEHDDSITVVKMEVIDEPETTFKEENKQLPDITCFEDIDSTVKIEDHELPDTVEQVTESGSNTLCTNKNCEKIRKENRQLKKKLTKLRKGLDRLIDRYDAVGDQDNVEYYIISDVEVKEES